VFTQGATVTGIGVLINDVTVIANVLLLVLVLAVVIPVVWLATILVTGNGPAKLDTARKLEH